MGNGSGCLQGYGGGGEGMCFCCADKCSAGGLVWSLIRRFWLRSPSRHLRSESQHYRWQFTCWQLNGAPHVARVSRANSFAIVRRDCARHFFGATSTPFRTGRPTGLVSHQNFNYSTKSLLWFVIGFLVAFDCESLALIKSPKSRKSLKSCHFFVCLSWGHSVLRLFFSVMRHSSI